MEGENLSQKLEGNLSPKLGEVAPDFDSRFGGTGQTTPLTKFPHIFISPYFSMGKLHL